MTNFVVSKWRGGTPQERFYVLDIRRAPEIKMVCETATLGLARMLCMALNKNEDQDWEE